MWRELRIEMSQDALMATPDPAPEPSELDRALLRAGSDEVAQLPDGVAKLTHAWSYGRGMWFVEVQPHEPRAALLSVAFDGNALLTSRSATSGSTRRQPAPRMSATSHTLRDSQLLRLPCRLSGAEVCQMVSAHSGSLRCISTVSRRVQASAQLGVVG